MDFIFRYQSSTPAWLNTVFLQSYAAPHFNVEGAGQLKEGNYIYVSSKCGVAITLSDVLKNLD